MSLKWAIFKKPGLKVEKKQSQVQRAIMLREKDERDFKFHSTPSEVADDEIAVPYVPEKRLTNRVKIAVIAKGGGGKNHLRDKLLDKGYRCMVSYTTRPKRAGEIDHVDYHFINEEQFDALIENDVLMEHDLFNGYRYGNPKPHEYDDIFILTPRGLSQIPRDLRRRLFVIFLDIPEDILKERLLKRGDNNDKVERRLESDRKDFENFTDFDMRITNPDW